MLRLQEHHPCKRNHSSESGRQNCRSFQSRCTAQRKPGNSLRYYSSRMLSSPLPVFGRYYTLPAEETRGEGTRPRFPSRKGHTAFFFRSLISRKHNTFDGKPLDTAGIQIHHQFIGNHKYHQRDYKRFEIKLIFRHIPDIREHDGHHQL